MSIFNWFLSKLRNKNDVKTGQPDPGYASSQATGPRGLPGSRKNERLERRELIYSVVRDAMLRAGVLAASYKFKVLSLDTRGSQYVIMMDLINQSAGDTGRLAEIEAVIAQLAKVRHDMLITAVYWRINEQVTTGLSRSLTQSTQEGQTKAPAYEPIQEEEVAAFKRALETVAQGSAQLVPGKAITTGRRNPMPPADFEDTLLVPPDRRASPLSGTQYGELN